MLLSLNIINHELQHLTQTLNIIPSSNHSYIIQDLVPGYEYSVNLTPKTTKGNLTLSHTYKVKPKFTGKYQLFNCYWINRIHIMKIYFFQTKMF